MFTAMRHASSRVSSLADASPRVLLVVDVGERLPVGVADDVAGLGFLGGPGRREAARPSSPNPKQHKTSRESRQGPCAPQTAGNEPAADCIAHRALRRFETEPLEPALTLLKSPPLISQPTEGPAVPKRSDNQIALFIRDEKTGSTRLQCKRIEGARYRSSRSARTGISTAGA